MSARCATKRATSLVYLDTSVIVAAITSELETPNVLLWLKSLRLGESAVSSWTIAEVSSAIMLKFRTGQLTEDERELAFAAWQTMLDSALRCHPVDNSDFQAAAVLMRSDNVALRAGDALHLAIARRLRIEVATLDRAMNAAAQKLGMVAHIAR